MKAAVFTPLFMLKTTTRRRWPRYRGGEVLTDAYEGYELPWKALDEDGEEDDATDEVGVLFVHMAQVITKSQQVADSPRSVLY
ncbi:hypothetical protein FRC08_014604 [Ceratobasidium sp. 394]|nr:hypothetical protein FRC08_014604 [Ceratobasidium sp. 394]